MKKLKTIIREWSDWRRFYSLATDERKIVFYAEHQGYYPYFEGLVNELINERRQVICYITSDQNDPILEDDRGGLHVFHLKTLLPYFMAFLKAKVFVMTLTDLGKFHLKRSMHAVDYVYVFHAMVSTHMMYKEGALDSYDTILCVGQYQVDEIRKREAMDNLPAKNLILAGYYRLERVVGAYEGYLANRSHSSVKEKIVLVAPSWGEKNILAECGEQLVGKLLSSGYRVIVRPHPEIVKRTPRVVDELVEKFGGDKNFLLEKGVHSDESLLKADVLITDLSGIAFEYALGTLRPVVFIDLPPKVKNPNWDKLGSEPIELSLRSCIGKLISIEAINILDKTIESLMDQRVDYGTELLKIRSNLVHDFGHSSKIGADTILKIADKTAL
ncbi:MAG: CDP-glycerol glycerophosphotransferase family protein [bacterium]|nr:CDP-glycerol glycerophosphotransferase family protein [bacterium]